MVSLPPDRQRRVIRVAFAVSFGILVLLAAWWTVLIASLVDENHGLQVALYGEAPAIQAEYQRKRMMVLGETTLMSAVALAMVAVAWRWSVQEQEQVRRLEGVLAASTHELKTPVAGLRALLESVASGVLPPERAGPHLQRGLEVCTRLEHLIEGILAYQSAVARPAPTVSRSVQAWVDEVMGHRAMERDTGTVRVELGEAGAASVRATPDGFRVVLENLLDNARKYGEGRPVRLSARLEGPLVWLDVEDQGAGFEPGDADMLFEPYQRGSAGAGRHGTGLGLCISRTLARQMRGDLRAASPGPGRGATFSLLLRRADDG